MLANVLLMVLDTARRDALEPYGAAPGSTPTVADLASRGHALPHVRSTACWTMPAHASMFTGLLPRACGLSSVPGVNATSCRPVMKSHGDRLLAEVLRRAGYATAGVSANPWLREQTGFTTGFDDWIQVRGNRPADMGNGGRRARLRWHRAALRAALDDGAAAAERQMSRWLERPPDRPFFWFVNLLECHSPYLPPRPYNDLSALDRLRAAEEARKHLTAPALWAACLGQRRVPADALARMRHLYGRSIRLMDDWLGRLLDRLERHGVLDDTLVLVTSDHGENFGDGGLMAHNFSLDERLTHVPFVAAGPGAGAFDGMLSLAELPRRIAAATGVERHPWREQLPDGVAVTQFDALGPHHDDLLDTVVNGWGLGDAAVDVLRVPLTAVTDGRYKLRRHGDREDLFDLRVDPLELQPLHPHARGPAVLGRLRTALRHPAAQTMWNPAAAGDSAAPKDEELAHLEQQMRLLGYA